MGFSFHTLLPHLEAFAYLCEIVIAEGLFLGHFEKRKHPRLYHWLGLPLMFLAGTLTGIPQGSSMLRFLWYFLLMAWRVLCAVVCFEGKASTVVSACMAGFATQHIANKLTILFRLIPPVGAVLARVPALGVPLEVLVFAGVYVLVYALFAKHIRPGGRNRPLNVLSATIIFLCIGVNRLVADHTGESVQYEAAVCVYAIIGCVFALIIQIYISRWEEERSQALIMRRLLADSERQYEQWKSSVEQVNIAVHDIKHVLAHAQALADRNQVVLPDLNMVRQAVDSYSASVRTGSDVLDVLLRNMNALCAQDQITLCCTACTDQLSQFDGMSLYFLFVNAIDNAIKSTALVEDPDKRIIDVSIRQFGGCAVIHIWNYYTGQLEFADGLPVTRQDSRIHGFGMKSIQLMVERLGGVLSVRTDGQVFHLDVLLPMEESAPAHSRLPHPAGVPQPDSRQAAGTPQA